MDAAGIVATNPPFSLFREHVTTLAEHGRKFVIVGPSTGVKRKGTLPLVRGGKVWLGHGFAKGDTYFPIPKENARGFAEGIHDEETGLARLRKRAWFTNPDIPTKIKSQLRKAMPPLTSLHSLPEV